MPNMQYKFLLIAFTFVSGSAHAQNSDEEQVVGTEFAKCSAITSVFVRTASDAGQITQEQKDKFQDIINAYSAYGMALLGKERAMEVVKETSLKEATMSRLLVKMGSTNKYSSYAEGKMNSCVSYFQTHSGDHAQKVKDYFAKE